MGIELGNEQYNSLFVEQVAAMEKRAEAVGKRGQLYYISPNNNNWLKPEDAMKAEELGLRDHLVEDFHVGGGGAVEGSKHMFAANTSWHEGMVNLETNAGIHTMNRALMEATDLNAFFNQFIASTSGDSSGRIKARTASFCTERSGHFDAFDQGITFFLPNGSWVQPPGFVHKMIHDTWMPDAVAVNASSGISCSAQRAEDGSRLRLLLVNGGREAIDVTLRVDGLLTEPNVSILTLSASDLDAANPPGDPLRISPVTGVAPLRNNILTVAGQSFTIAVFTKATEAVVL